MAAPGNLVIEHYSAYVSQNQGYNSALPIATTSTITAGSGQINGNLAVTGTLSAGAESVTAQTITSASANAFAVGPNGTTNPSLNVDASTASAATGVNIKSAAAGAGVVLSAISSGTNENLTIQTKGSGTLNLNNGNGGGNYSVFGGNVGVDSTSNHALAIGPSDVTNPAFNVDASTGSMVAGLNVKGDVTGGTVAISAIDSGANTNLSITGKGTGVVKVSTLIETNIPTAINATATATAAQVITGYITSTSAAATTITMPTGTLLGTALGAVRGTVFDLYIDNTAGANTVTMAVAVNGILSAAAAANAGSQGLLTVPSGVTGQACFRIMFSSATAYTFTRIA